MPFVHGRLTEVLLDEKDISSYLNKMDLNVDVEPGDTTTFKKAWKTYEPGLASAGMEAGGLFDHLFTDVRDALQVTPDSIISYAPGGALAIGDQVRQLAGVTATYKESAPVGGMVAFAWNATANDTLGIGNSFHALGPETVTGNATPWPPSGGAQTLLGAVAHLHITAIGGTATPTLTVKFQDSTTFGGAYTDIASGAFSAATAIGAQRLIIPGTIRAFVRAAWTISGTTPSFTFAVSLARRQ